MTDKAHENKVREPHSTFVFDGAYVRDQAKAAMATYFAPLKGLYDAASGEPDRRRDPDKKRA